MVKPELLLWARLAAGMDQVQVATKLRVSRARLDSWENGENPITVAQLRRIAAIYKRPLAVFYLARPPKDFDAMHDFRRLPGRVAGIESPELRLEIRRAIYRREVAVDLSIELDDQPTEFDARVELADDPESVGSKLRELIGIPHEVQKAWKDEYEALRSWRRAIEELSILVFQARKVPTQEMLGFSIAERMLPVIVVNIKYSIRGRIFTLLHEVAHILLRQTGLCDLDDQEQRAPSDLQVEAFCNHVAGAALVPREQLTADLPADQSLREWSDDEIVSLARRYWVSREVIVRRLLILGRTTKSFYERKRHQYQSENSAQRKRSGFTTPDRIVLSTAGEPFVRLVLSGYANEKITSSDVADFLDVQLKHIPKIERRLLYRPSLAAP